jgi:nitrate reductase NapE component
MDEKKSRAVDNKSESTSHNFILYAFVGIIGISFIAIFGYIIYSLLF